MKQTVLVKVFGLAVAMVLAFPTAGLLAQAPLNPPNDPGNPNAPISRTAANNDEFNKRRAEMRQRLDSIKQNVQEKLQGQRLQVCQQRQAKVNQTLDKITANARRQLLVVSTVQLRVENFYKDKKMSVANYDQLAQTANAKRQAAEGVFDAVNGVNFDCQAQDGRNVGQNVKEVVSGERQALKEYRQAVKDLLLAVKQAAGQSTANPSGVR